MDKTLERIHEAVTQQAHPLFYETLIYIEKILQENENLKKNLSIVNPENFHKPVIVNSYNHDNNENSDNLPQFLSVSPFHGSLGFATYQKIIDYVESETANYFVFSGSNQGMTNTMSYLNRIDLKNKFLFLIDFYDLCNVELNEIIETQKESLSKYKSICDKSNKKFILLIVAPMEAPTYRYNLKDYCDWVVNFLSIPLDQIFIYSGAQHQYKDGVKHAICHSGLIHVKPFENTIADGDPLYHFVSLARISRPHRVLATVEILERNLQNYGHCSLGSGFYNNPNENFDLNIVPEKFKHLMPMFIDGLIANSAFYKQHLTEDQRITRAFVNLVHETSYDYEISPRTWNVQFVTEKATKPFIWGQVPIYNMMAGSIQHIRELGFDVFDDIIDHSYDNEPDPNRRIKLVIDQLEKICKLTLEECVQFKRTNISRFIKNREVATYIKDIFVPQINYTNLKVGLESYDI